MKVRPGTHRGEHAPESEGPWIHDVFAGKLMGEMCVNFFFTNTASFTAAFKKLRITWRYQPSLSLSQDEFAGTTVASKSSEGGSEPAA